MNITYCTCLVVTGGHLALRIDCPVHGTCTTTKEYANMATTPKPAPPTHPTSPTPQQPSSPSPTPNPAPSGPSTPTTH